MSVEFMTYGSTDPIPFMITLDGDPVLVEADLDLVDGDIILRKWTSGGGIVDRQIDVSAEITVVNQTSHVSYYWTPASSADTECNWGHLIIRDVSSGGVFDGNSIIFYTGGDALARFGST